MLCQRRCSQTYSILAITASCRNFFAGLLKRRDSQNGTTFSCFYVDFIALCLCRLQPNAAIKHFDIHFSLNLTLIYIIHINMDKNVYRQKSKVVLVHCNGVLKYILVNNM